MKKSYLLIFILLFTLLPLHSQIVILVNKGGPYYTGDLIGFNKTCHDYTRGVSTWNFGDGTTKSLSTADDYGWQFHTYSEAGNYTVSFKYGPVGFVSPICPEITITHKIKIEPVRAVSASPSNPKVDQLVYFTASNFIGSSLIWDVGEGPSFSGGPYQTHRYQQTGVYTVSVMEKDIKHMPATAVVTVSPDDRFIQISAPEVRIGEPVFVYTRNFNGETVLLCH